jgi:hypothetical protein
VRIANYLNSNGYYEEGLRIGDDHISRLHDLSHPLTKTYRHLHPRMVARLEETLKIIK